MSTLCNIDFNDDGENGITIILTMWYLVVIFLMIQKVSQLQLYS